MLLILSLILGTIATITYPFLTNVSLFMTSMLVQGIVSGVFDVAVNSWVLDLWGENCSTYMQGLHFSFAVGMFAGPFIIAPFSGLEPKVETKTLLSAINDNLPADRVIRTTAKSLFAFQMVYILTGVLMFSSAIVQIILYVMENRLVNRLCRDDNQNILATQDVQSTCSKKSDLKQTSSRSVLILGAFILFVYVGMEVNSFNFVTEYVHFLNYDVETATNQATIMGAAFALGRLIGFFVSRFLSSDTMAVIHVSTVALGTVILLLFSSISLIWLSLGLFTTGFGFSILFPTVYSMIEERTRLSNLSVSFFVFSGSVASIIYPIVVPFFLKNHPNLFLYNNAVSVLTVLILVVYLILKTVR